MPSSLSSDAKLFWSGVAIDFEMVVDGALVMFFHVAVPEGMWALDHCPPTCTVVLLFCCCSLGGLKPKNSSAISKRGPCEDASQ